MGLQRCSKLFTALSQDLYYTSKRYGGRAYWFPQLLYYLKRNKDLAGPQEIVPRYSLYNWNIKTEINAFIHRVNEGLTFDDLAPVFMHPSNEDIIKSMGKSDKDTYYKKFDLGQNFVDLFVKQYLRKSFPLLPEEAISDIKNNILSYKNLANIATLLGMKDLILSSTYPPSSEILSETLLTFIGAIISVENTKTKFFPLHEDMNKPTYNITYESLNQPLDSFEPRISRAAAFTLDFICTQLISIDIFELWNLTNAFRLFKSVVTKDYQNSSEAVSIEARLLRTSGINTIFPIYMVGIYVNREFYAQGSGETLSLAIDQAARQGLKTRFNIPLTNVGNSLNFDKFFVIPAILNDNNPLPNKSIFDLMSEQVDIQNISDDIEASQFITSTNDNIMYEKFLN